LANTAALIGGLLALSPVSGSLAAQAAPAASKCDVNQDKPKELALAYLSFTRVSSSPVGPARDPLIKTMLRDLMDKPEKFASNPGGYNYILSQVLTMAAQQPDGVVPKPRSAMGLTSRPTDIFDVSVELDSAYRRWEAAIPACAADIAIQRNSEAWLAVTNKAFSFVEKGPADSAGFYAKRSIMLAPNNPFAHHILATVAQGKNDMAGAVPEWTEVVKLAAADTSFKDIKLNALFYLGLADLQEAQKLSGDAQKAKAKTAAAFFKEYLTIHPMSPDAASVMTNWAGALQLAGDVEGQKAIYADMAANPSKYSETVLANAGVIASQANDMAAAVKLFGGMVEVNPLSRDGLRNYASTLYSQEKFVEMFPVLRKLIEVDPNNFDGVMMFAYAAQGLEKNEKVPATKKQWTDTLVKYSTAADKMNARVEVTGFSRAAESADVTLQIEQAGATAGTYSVQMEFLDKSGAVVTTATESVGPIAKGEKKTVVLKGKGAGIVAFRYKSLG
ncbi:MAG: hypothetical protein ABI852_19000, partial [Gemmatimonadaceae bacterium]